MLLSDVALYCGSFCSPHKHIQQIVQVEPKSGALTKIKVNCQYCQYFTLLWPNLVENSFLI